MNWPVFFTVLLGVPAVTCIGLVVALVLESIATLFGVGVVLVGVSVLLTAAFATAAALAAS